MFTKVKRVFQIPLILLLAVLMFFSALPSFSVSAATGITLSVYSGSPGATVTISGTFDTVANGAAIITFDDVYIGLVTISSGSFNSAFQVPVLPRGKYAVTVAVEGSSISLSEEFTIKPGINIDKNTVYVGEQITIAGSGFSSGNVAIYMDNASTPLIITTADASGVLNPVTITVPAANKATHILKAVDATGAAGAVFTTFNIIPSIKLSDEISGAGAQITITGNGFASSSMITISLNSVVVPTSSIVTDINGTFIANITLSLSMAKGNYSITAADTTGNTAVTNLTIRQSISISKETGNVNDVITVSGASFDPNKAVSIYFDSTALAYAQTDAYGVFSATLTVPIAAQGEYAVKAVDSNSNEAAELFTIEPYITITPAADKVGTRINISGYGFAAASNTIIYFNSTSVSTVITSSVGVFSVDVLIPVSPGGEHLIKAVDEQANQSSILFTTVPDISLDYNTGTFGDTVIISGTGFAAGSSLSNMIAFTIGTAPLSMNEGNIFTDIYGSFTASFNVPDIINGAHIIKATDTFGNTDNIQITVESSIISNISTGVAGDEVQISGYGFAPNKKLDIRYNDVIVNATLGTVTTSVTGSFIASFILPNINAGAYTIEVSDGTNTAAADFIQVYETIPPPAVTLISPVDGDKIAQPVLFNWSASSDPSGVFYRIQVGTDATFSTLLVDVSDLTTTTYTMNAENKLDSVNAKSPYHWRVMAIDGVGNASGWTADTFVVGFVWPVWLTYVLIGIAGLVFLIVMGVWLGRRIAAVRDDKTYNYDMDTDLEYRYREQYPDASLDCTDKLK